MHAVNLKHLGHFLDMHMHFTMQHTVSLHKDGGWSENMKGHNPPPPPVEIGLTDLKTSGGEGGGVGLMPPSPLPVPPSQL